MVAGLSRTEAVSHAPEQNKLCSVDSGIVALLCSGSNRECRGYFTVISYFVPIYLLKLISTLRSHNSQRKPNRTAVYI
jgi:hypothetical protein